MFRRSYAEVFAGDERWNGAGGPGRRALRLGRALDLRAPAALLRGHAARARAGRGRRGARVLALLGDSVTTDHISPAGAIKRDSPAGLYLQEQGVAPRDFNSYGARRGNHEVMMRGTFANIRLRNLLGWRRPAAGGRRHACTCPSGEQMSIYDAAMRYAQRGRRRWSCSPARSTARAPRATGPPRARKLLGVRAVIAESFERIHRSNLVGMGVLPLQFPDGRERRVARAHRRGDVRDRGPRRGDERGRGSARGAQGARDASARVPTARPSLRARAHRHPARGRVLPPRRHPPVRAACAARVTPAPIGTDPAQGGA